MENIKKREGKYKEETRRSLVKESAWKKIEGIGGREEEEERRRKVEARVKIGDGRHRERKAE